MEKRAIVRDYIQKHPQCSGKEIKVNTKLKVERIYTSLREAYLDAEVNLSKSLTRRNLETQKNDVIQFIKENPKCTIPEIRKNVRVNITRVFGDIISAYKKANVDYPFRERIRGVANPAIVQRSLEFERRMIYLLSKIGSVQSKVRTKAGIADCVFRQNGTTYIVEVKDFRGGRNITQSQIKQLMKYMVALECNNGLLVCPRESFPKRKNNNNLYIDGLKIKIISEEEIQSIGDVV